MRERLLTIEETAAYLRATPGAQGPRRNGRRHRTDHLRPTRPGSTRDQLSDLLLEAEADVTVYAECSPHWKRSGPSPVERLTREIKRRADVVGIFPSYEHAADENLRIANSLWAPLRTTDFSALGQG